MLNIYSFLNVLLVGIDWSNSKNHIVSAALSFFIIQLVLWMGVGVKWIFRRLQDKPFNLYELCKGGEMILGSLCVIGVIGGDLMLSQRQGVAEIQYYGFAIVVLVLTVVAYFATLIDYCFLEKNTELLEITQDKLRRLIDEGKMQVKDFNTFKRRFNWTFSWTSLVGCILLYISLYIDKVL